MFQERPIPIWMALRLYTVGNTKMRQSVLHLLLCAVVVAALLHPEAAGVAPPERKIKGMAFTSGHFPWQYRQPFATTSLQRLRATGAEYVHITVILGMNDINSTTSYIITTDETVRYIIRKAQRLRFEVFLKPIVQTRQFVWRGFIPPTKEWFNNVYLPYIVRMARIAQEEGVALFSVGSELRNTIEERGEWLRVISAIRAVYKRPITYVANHDSFERVSFWDQLDFISLSAYFKLLDSLPNGTSPDLAQTKLLWQNQARAVLRWRNASGLNDKKILIAEAGAMSKGNGVVYTMPWDYDAVAPTDFDEQVKIYEGLLATFMPPRWSLGVILYDWHAQPDAGTTFPSIQSYTPQNKPALSVMRRFFKRKY